MMGALGEGGVGDVRCDAVRDVDIDVKSVIGALPVYSDGAVGGVACHFHPLQALWGLRKNVYGLVSWRCGDYASESLVEPAVGAVVAVVVVAAWVVPVLSRSGGSVAQHVEVAGVVGLLQHVVEEINVARTCGPFCQHRHPYESHAKMSAHLCELVGYVVH